MLALSRINDPNSTPPRAARIANVLRAVQAAREARQREVSLERERKATLMAHLFTHGTRGEPTKQTPIGEMPVSWEVRRLERCDVRRFTAERCLRTRAANPGNQHTATSTYMTPIKVAVVNVDRRERMELSPRRTSMLLQSSSNDGDVRHVLDSVNGVGQCCWSWSNRQKRPFAIAILIRVHQH